MPIIETKFGIICIVTNMWWNIVVDDWNLDVRSLSKWQKLQHYKSIIPNLFYKKRQYNVRLTLSVHDTTPGVHNSIEQDN